MKAYIYQIRNLLDGKVYIGQTIRLKKRQQQHFTNLRNKCHDNRHLQSAFNKYGENNFVFEILNILEDCGIEEINALEIKIIASIDKKHKYNIAPGGTIGMKNKKHSHETLIKLSEAHIGKKLPIETRLNMSKAQKGRCAGDKNPYAKLTEQQVREIKFGHLMENKLTNEKIGQLYGVSNTTISRIKLGIDWNHIKPLETQENQILMLKNRKCMSVGENRYNTKLTNAQVREIKFKHLVEKKLTNTEIAKLYNISNYVVSDIKLGKTWTHIKPLDTQEYPINKKGFQLGEKHYNAKLIGDQVREIKFKYLTENKLTHQEIANLYNVSVTAIFNIKTGKSWAHIKPLESNPELSATLGGSI
jgi:group I intron endonuclease